MELSGVTAPVLMAVEKGQPHTSRTLQSNEPDASMMLVEGQGKHGAHILNYHETKHLHSPAAGEGHLVS